MATILALRHVLIAQSVLSSSLFKLTSSGYSFVIGRDVSPFLVRMTADLASPSPPPTMSFSTTASVHLILGESS